MRGGCDILNKEKHYILAKNPKSFFQAAKASRIEVWKLENSCMQHRAGEAAVYPLVCVCVGTQLQSGPSETSCNSSDRLAVLWLRVWDWLIRKLFIRKEASEGSVKCEASFMTFIKSSNNKESYYV